MNVKRVKTVALTSMFMIICIQIVWSIHIYVSKYSELDSLCNKAFSSSVFKEVMGRIDSTFTEGVEIQAGIVRDDGTSDYVFFQDTLVKCNVPISIDSLNSFYQSDLLAEDIHSQTIIKRINTKTGEVMESTDSMFRESWGTINTHPEYLRRDSSEAVVAVVISPVRNVLSRVWLLYLCSIVLIGFAGWGLYNQVKIIFYQKRLSEIRETFSRAMVHDMKTPISSIMMGVDRLKSGVYDNLPKKKELVFEMVEMESQHLLSLVNKVLTIAKMENGKLALDRKQIRLRVMVDTLVDKYLLRSNKSITFNVDVPEDAVVYADPSHLTECLSNLIENAEKYSGKSVQIDISYVFDGVKSIIRVADNGVGIPQNKHTLIFEKFERVSAGSKRSASEVPTGFGLGLNYVQLMMKEHGGSVTVQSEVGRGSAFTLTFPAQTT